MEGWCAIQKKLGEEYLSIMCSTYPRVMNVVDDVLQRSLSMSCPEAARVTLLDSNPMEFDEEEGTRSDARLGHLSFLSTVADSSQKPYAHFSEIRSLIIWLLQNRKYSLWKRMVMLGSLCDQLHSTADDCKAASETPEVLTAYRDAIDRGVFDEALSSHRPQPAKQLELVLELIVDRIGSDFTAVRFQECYREFMAGLDWTTDVGMDQLGRRYAAAYSEWYLPLMSKHEHVMEHYLVSYVHRTLFPLGAQESSRKVAVSYLAICDQCMIMFVYFAILQTVAIGMAGFHQAQFDVAHVLKVIQSTAKAFEHSVAFPTRALKILVDNGIPNCAAMAILLLN
jgi:lysine-N-methylase